MTTYQALYYPYIHFKDDAWLKLTALYWDKLGRIVPSGYSTDDSPTVKALGSFVTVLRPESADSGFAKPFISFIEQYAPKLKAKYALSLRDTWQVIPEVRRPPRPGGPSGNDPRLGYIYYEKILDDVYLALNESGLASTDFRGSQWIGMHPRLAWVYMTMLAEHVAEKHGLRALTDETRDHVALSGLSIERLAQALLDDSPLLDSGPTASEIEAVLVSVAFRTIVPKNLAELKVDKILAFRDKYPKERAKFQIQASNFLTSSEWLKSISDPKVLEQRLRDEFDKKWAAELDDLREKLTEVGIDTMFSCFNLKAALPAGLATAAAIAGLSLNPIVAGAAGLTLGAIPVFRDKRKAARDALKASPVSYLYRMEQDLKPADLWSWVKQRSLKLALNA